MTDWFDGRLASQITAPDLEALVATGAREDQRLEFKREYPPQKHHEVLKDVIAFANADGGYLVIGVVEARGRATAFRPVEHPNRLAEAIWRSCLENIVPRVEDLEVAQVRLPDGGVVIVVRVPDSAQKPHMHILGGRTQFARRYGTENRAMSIDEIRASFLGDSVLRGLARLQADVQDLRGTRRIVLGDVTARDNPLDTHEPEELARLMGLRFRGMAGDRPFYRTYLLPKATLDPSALDTYAEGVQEVFRNPPSTRSGGWTIWQMPTVSVTPEGLEGTAGPEQRVVALRNGYTEFTHPARSESFQWRQSEEEAARHPYLYPYALCEFTVSFVRFCGEVYRAVSLELPVQFGLELVGVHGFRLLPGLPDRGQWRRATLTGYPEPYAGEWAAGSVDIENFPSDPDPIAYHLLVQIYQQFGNRPESVPLFDEDHHFRAERG